ncbi:MAG: hypothetical protein ACM3SM_02470 [Bacteroidota bacterium]
MKTIIFANAIFNHCKIRFLYGLEEVVLEPCFVTFDSRGKKTLYGRTASAHGEIRSFQFSRIANIKLLNSIKIEPDIPVISQICLN